MGSEVCGPHQTLKDSWLGASYQVVSSTRLVSRVLEYLSDRSMGQRLNVQALESECWGLNHSSATC